MNFLTDRDALAAILNRGKDWYSIKNVSDDVAEIHIYNEIGYFGVTAEEFMNEVRGITAPQINVRINSIGGSVFDGVAIYNTLRSHPSNVTTQVDGLAASIASVIFQAGERRVMLDKAQLMIHEAAGIAMGTADDIEEYAAVLRRQTDLIADIYTEAIGDKRKKSTVLSMMADETWFTDQEAVDAGLADEVVQPTSQKIQPTKAEDDVEEESQDEEAEAKAKVDFSDLFDLDLEEILI